MCIDLGCDNRTGDHQRVSQYLSANERRGRFGRCANNAEKVPHPIEQDDRNLVIAGPAHGFDRNEARPSCHNNCLGLARGGIIYKPILTVAHDQRATRGACHYVKQEQ
jgi:hypothetical protein